jgi:hypothetical protein
VGPSALEFAQAAEEEKMAWPDRDRFHGRYGQVRLQASGAERTTAVADIAADGAFRMTGIPAGNYEVWAQASWLIGPLATVSLRGGESATVALDLTAHLPGTVAARFLVDGVLWHGEAGLAPFESGGTDAFGQTDADGILKATRVLPDRYLPFVGYYRDGRAFRMFADVPFTLVAGADVGITADIHRRRVAVTLLDADGKPVADRRLAPEPVDLLQFAWAWRDGARTDQHGVAVFDPAPRGPLRVCAFAPVPPDSSAEPAEVVLGGIGADVDAATLRLPRNDGGR